MYANKQKGVLVLAVKNIADAKPKKKKLRKVHYLWILLAVMGFMVLFGKISSNYIKLGQLDKEIEAIQQQITELDAESDEIQAILDEENHDEYFEKIAREEYGYCKPGEKVYYNSSFGE